MPVVIRGMRELSAAFAKTDRDLRLGYRHALRDVAEPVRRDAEIFAQMTIPRIGHVWWRMRTGITRSLVYVAPRQKGARQAARRQYRRPNFAGLLMDRAMEPALHTHEADLERAAEQLLDKLADDFNRGGPM